MKSKLTKNQTKIFTKKISLEPWGYRIDGYIKAIVRHDDNCGNGHNTFTITGEISYPGARDCIACGCIHDEISKHFPHLRPYLKWHGCTTDGPLHYISNTLYHAGDLDFRGLRKGEKRQLRNGKTGQLCWELVQDRKLPKYIDADERPQETATLHYEPWYITGQGKERDLESARASAIWPDASDGQLCAPRDILAKALCDRLPALMDDFAKAVTELGLTY